MNKRISIHIATRDRWTELGLLLESLRHQTYQNFDIIILDDASGTPIITSYFLLSLFNRIKLEGHKIKHIRNNITFGCCSARNKCIEEDDFDNIFTCRLDDHVVLASDYLEKLVESIESGYDMITGIIPHLTHPENIREIKFVKPIINEHKLDSKGNLIMNKDDCAFGYTKDEIIPTHQFRTNCLYKSIINKTVRYPDNLTTVAFREEGFFSFKAIIEGYKIGVRTGAVAWHLQTPSGGNRRQDYAQCVQIDEETWKKWVKKQFEKHGDFLNKYNKEVLNASKK